jgi:uncharacterized protein YgbK (DUF1537 family)
MVTPRVLIIADDLTGAMDSASPFAARGFATWVLADAEADDDVSMAQVLSVNAETRHLSAEAAAHRVQSVWRNFSVDRPVLVKKIDSTLRGQVVAETIALQRASGRAQVLLAPAFPAQGRTVSGGVVHVRGVPIEQSAFARDALAPPPITPLHTLFSHAGFTAKVTAPAGPFDAADVFVPDTASEDDLDATLGGLSDRLQQTLLVGSAGLTHVLAAKMGERGVVSRRPAVSKRILFVIGSRAAQSDAQVKALCAVDGTAVIELPAHGETNWPSEAAQLVLRAPRVVGDAKQVARRLARCALSLRERGHAHAVVATGGDTAVAFLAAAGRGALNVLGELAPGIPYSQIDVNGEPCWVVTKAGGFGDDATLIEVTRRLRAGDEHN